MSISFDEVREQSRSTLFKKEICIEEKKSPVILSSIELLNIFNQDEEPTDKELYDTITRLHHNIEQMNDDEINSFSEFFPYQEIFKLITEYENEEIQETLFWCFCLMTKSKNFQTDDFITPFNLLLLLIFLDHPKFSICSLYFLSFLCSDKPKLCQIFCEQGLLDKFSGRPFTKYHSQLILILCLHVKTAEFQIQLSTIVLSLFESETMEIIDDALKSYMSLSLNSHQNESVIEKVHQISDFLVENFEKFVNLNNLDVVSDYLDIIANINELPDELIPHIFGLLENESLKIVRSGSNVLTVQCKNWIEKVDVDLLYKIMFSKFEMDISVDYERVFFTCLLKYGNAQLFILPQMISRIVKFLSFDKYIYFSTNCAFDCLNAVLLILTTSGKSADVLFGDLLEDVYSIVSEQYQNGSDESSEIASQILIFLDQSNER